MRIIIISGANPLRAYSGLKYLTKELMKYGKNVQLISKIPKSMMKETNNWDINLKSFYDSWYGNLFGIRKYIAKLHTLYLGIFKADTIIFHELTFIKEMVFLKKIFPNKKFIHYATELYTEKDEPSHASLLKYYKKHANFVDLIIECEENRSAVRKKMYNIANETVVIPNTLPLSEVIEKGEDGDLAKLSGMRELPKDLPVIVYTGGAYYHRELDRIVEACKLLNKSVFFLAFCYGDQNTIKDLRKICDDKLGKSFYKICDAVPRDELLKCIHEATAGIVYYRPSLSIGNLYAAPTKLFEYIAAGVPVISSNNPGLVKMINKYNLGICVKDESIESLANAIKELVINKENIKNIRHNQEKYFKESLCYEVMAKDAIEKIINISERGRKNENYNIC